MWAVVKQSLAKEFASTMDVWKNFSTYGKRETRWNFKTKTTCRYENRPNYFVAIKIDNFKTTASVKNIQNHLVKKEKILQSALIDVNTLHITLLVCHIANNEELERACSALSKVFQVLKEDLSINPLELTFEGIDNFNNKVIFMKISQYQLERLRHIREQVLKTFESSDIDITDKEKFTPHLTILKLSKDPKLWDKGIRKVECCLYEEFKDEQFGTEIVKGLQLLDMKCKDNNGYYHCCKEFLFENLKEE
ncbi:A-kinase anchor protein 7 isoforms delta and gamma-like [Centruroides vittatus]|uniref:A-kinase anchor protein 7 isoforms delta and gamma-like n=1 Tax=Centruroides vittatus TaxID=120091 RepID=UPI00350F678C